MSDKPVFGTLDEIEPGTPTVCRVLYFPDVQAVKLIINRVLSLPSFAGNWVEVGQLTARDSAEIFKEIIISMEDRCMIGEIRAHVLDEIPDWALACDGSSHSRADYPRLYDCLHPAFIVDSETFITPDLRGRAMIGETPAHGNISERLIGQSGGAETHTLSIGEIPSHAHEYTPPVPNVDIEAPGVPDLLAAGMGFSTNTGSAGGGLSHNNMQPFAVIGFYIVAR